MILLTKYLINSKLRKFSKSISSKNKGIHLENNNRGIWMDCWIERVHFDFEYFCLTWRFSP